MEFTKEELRKAIKDILKGADLDSLSAKKVRLSLQEKYDTDLTARKKEIDELVMTLISESQESQDNDESSDEEEIEEPPTKKKKPAPVTKPKPLAKKTPVKVSTKGDDDTKSSSDDDVNDEELAQKLQDELNEGGRRTRNRKTPKKPKKERKSGGERKGTSTYSRPCYLSQELAAVMGTEQMARNEVVKKMWQIVKDRNLQDPKNKQFMICDEQLLPLFGKKKVKTFGMMKYLKNHIKDAKDVTS